MSIITPNFFVFKEKVLMKVPRIKATLLIIFSLCFYSFIFANEDDSGTKYLEQTSKAFTEIAKKATPAVVSITAQFNKGGYQGQTAEDYENPFDYFSDEFFKRFFGNKGMPGQRFKSMPQQPQVSAGSGFIVSDNGYILTNNHVVKDAEKITVALNNGDEYEAKIVGSDSRTDVAVIKIEAENLDYLSFGNSDNLEIGEWVIAIGTPFTLQASLTVGVVSAKGRQNLRITELEDFIQTDAAINPGNSGGPLLDLHGNVIGINTAIVSKNGGYMGIGFAIPSNMAKYVMNQIIDTGMVKRGYLGVYLQSVDKEIAEAFSLDHTEGVLVAEVSKDSPAEDAGIKQGDIIISYNGAVIKNIHSFRNELSLLEPGTEVGLSVLRDGKKEEITVKLGTSPNEPIATTKESSQLGIDVSEPNNIAPEILQKYGIAPNSDGLVITSVKAGSLGYRAGLKPGMLILQVNQTRTKTPNDYNEALADMENRKHMLLLIRYQNITRFLTIRMQN